MTFRSHKGDTPFQHGERLFICTVDFFWRAQGGCRIGYSPMRRDRIMLPSEIMA
jgi:hypothetical protein